MKKILLLIGILGILLAGLLSNSSCATVDTGNRGVVTTFGKAQDFPRPEGFTWIWIPFQNIEQMSIRNQIVTVKAEAASKDLQDIDSEIAVNYRLKEESIIKVYRTLGKDYDKVVISPAIQEVVKAITANYNAEDLIKERPQVKNDIQVALANRLSEYGVEVLTVSVTNFDFSETFNNAIEAKMVAQQRALEAENKLREIEVEARQAVAIAEGQANALKIMGLAQSEYNKAISESLTPEVNQARLIEKLNGTEKVIIVPSNQAIVVNP